MEGASKGLAKARAYTKAVRHDTHLRHALGLLAVGLEGGEHREEAAAQGGVLVGGVGELEGPVRHLLRLFIHVYVYIYVCVRERGRWWGWVDWIRGWWGLGGNATREGDHIHASIIKYAPGCRPPPPPTGRECGARGRCGGCTPRWRRRAPGFGAVVWGRGVRERGV